MAKGLLSKLKLSFRGGKGTSQRAQASSHNTPPHSPTKETQNPTSTPVWSAARLNLTEKVWGDGYITPGGAEQVKKILPLLDIDSKKSVLVLGPALGGVHETIVEMTGAWLTGLEGDAELAALGHDSMKRDPTLKRQAPIKYADLEHLKLKPRSFDSVVSFEGTVNVAHKEALFSAVAEALRPHGELMFTTIVLADAAGPGPRAQAWIDAEPDSAKPHPWPVPALVALLESLHMEVRPVEDITADYRRWVMQGFMQFLGALKKPQLRDVAQELMGEVEYWTARINALDAGEIRVVRFHAIKLPDKRKSVEELLAKT